MRGIKRILDLDTVGSSVSAAVLSGLCAALWFFRVFRHGGADWVEWFGGAVWLAVSVIWALRAYRVYKHKKEEAS